MNKKEIAQLKEAVGLLDSMVRCGEAVVAKARAVLRKMDA